MIFGIHTDEATPHLHIDYVPIGHFNRGVDTQNGLSQALREMGFTGINAISDWRISERKVLEQICNAHGIEIKLPEKSRGSFAVEEYKVYKDNIAALDSEQTQKQSQLDNLNQQVEFTQGHVDFLDKEVDEKSAKVEQLDGEHSALETAIQSDKSELDKITKKKADVKAVENMEVKHTMFGGKVTLAEDDFNNLQTLAQKQIVSAKSTKKLKSEVAELKAENRELSEKVEDLTEKSGKSIRLQIENDKLKQRVSLLDKILEFIDRLGLREKLDLFLNQPKREQARQNSHEL